MKGRISAVISLFLCGPACALNSAHTYASDLGVQYNNAQFQIETKRKPDRLTKRQQPQEAPARMDPSLITNLLPKSTTAPAVRNGAIDATVKVLPVQTVVSAAPAVVPQEIVSRSTPAELAPPVTAVAQIEPRAVMLEKRVPIGVPELSHKPVASAPATPSPVTRAACQSGLDENTFTVCFDTKHAQIPMNLYSDLREFTLNNDLFDVIAYAQEPGIDNYRLGAARINAVQMNIRALKDSVSADQVATQMEYLNDCQKDCQNKVVIVARVFK